MASERSDEIADDFADDFAAANTECVAFVRSCSQSQWPLPVPGEGRIRQSAWRAARTSSAGSGRAEPGASIVSWCTVPLNGAGGV